MSDLYRPSSLEEALELMCHVEKISPVAGGTDWTIARRANVWLWDNPVLDLSGLDELKSIEQKENQTVVGALVTMTELELSPLVQERHRALSMAAGSVGSEQIRNSATVGGNVANASPAGDTPPALASLDAVVRLSSTEGTREMAILDFFTGRSASARKPHELVTALVLPVASDRISSFAKVGSRRELTISRLNLAASVRVAGDSFVEPRVCMGTLGMAARRSLGAEEALCAGSLEAFTTALQLAIDEAISGRSTAPYKKSAVRALAEDVMNHLCRQREELK